MPTAKFQQSAILNLFPVCTKFGNSDLTFSFFKSKWVEFGLHNFPLMQLDAEMEADYLCELYEAGMNKLVASELIDQIWAIYVLYVIFECQKSRGKYLIPMEMCMVLGLVVYNGSFMEGVYRFEEKIISSC